MSRATRTTSPYRRKLYARIHIQAQRFGMDDGAYRDFLAAHFDGRRSATLLTDREIVRAVRDMERLHRRGARPKKYDDLGHRPGMATARQLRMIEAMWHGVSTSTNRTRALRRFLFARFGVSDIAFLDLATAAAVIEALKRMDRGLHEGALHD